MNSIARLMLFPLVGLIVIGIMLLSVVEAEGEYWYRYGPYIDKITFPVMKDYTLRLLAFEVRELSLVGVLPQHLERIRTNRPDAHIIFTVGINSLGALHFNVELWPVKYYELRAALAHLWNRDRIIAESPLKGLAVKCTTIPPPTQGVWVNWEADFEKLYPYNPGKAKELLAKVFVPCLDPDGRTAWCDPREGGRVVEIEILSLPEATIPTYWWIAQYIKAEAEAIGLKVAIKEVSGREMNEAIAAGTAQAWIIGWLFGRFPEFLYRFFHSREIRLEGWNEWRVRNPRLDDLLDRFYFTKDVREAMVYAWKAQEILVREVIPWIPTYTPVAITAFDGAIERDSVVLNYAPPFMEPSGFSAFWFNTVRFKGRRFGGTLRYYHTVDISTYHPATYLWASEAEAIFRVYVYAMLPRPEDVYSEPRVPILLRYFELGETFYEGERVYRFTLTLFEGVRWQDGVEVTAADWAFTLLKFGKELKTRRYYAPWVDNLMGVRVVNKTTLELYLRDYGWMDVYSITEFVVLPMHIFARLPDPLADPSTLMHPTRPELSAMVGNGPFALAGLRRADYSELVWNPWYYWRHPDRTVQFLSVTVPELIVEGTPFKVSVTLVDYLGARTTNASVTIRLTGPVEVVCDAVHVGGGVYESRVDRLSGGIYSVEIRAEQPIMLWSVDNTYRTTLKVVPYTTTVTSTTTITVTRTHVTPTTIPITVTAERTTTVARTITSPVTETTTATIIHSEFIEKTVERTVTAQVTRTELAAQTNTITVERTISLPTSETSTLMIPTIVVITERVPETSLPVIIGIPVTMIAIFAIGLMLGAFLIRKG